MKNDMKIQIVLAAILTVATLVGVNALMSAVQKADHGTAPAAVDDTSTKN